LSVGILRLNRGKRRRVEITVGRVEIRMIGDVEEFNAKLHALVLTDREILPQRYVPIDEPRSDDAVPPGGAEALRAGRRERTRIKPCLCGAYFTSRDLPGRLSYDRRGQDLRLQDQPGRDRRFDRDDQKNLEWCQCRSGPRPG